MEQFVFAPAFVYDNSLITQSIKKQELPQYQPVQMPTYQIDSLKEQINKKLFAKVDSIVDKTLFCPRIMLSISQFFILDGLETKTILSDFPQLLRRNKADVPDNYLSLQDAVGISPTLILNQNAKTRERGTFQNVNVRSCNGCTHKIVLDICQCAT